MKFGKIKIKAPKIKLGDPTKLITKPIEGLANSQASLAKSVVGNIGDVAGAAVGSVGQVMSQPGAGALLGAAGTAFGMPEIGMLGGLFNKPQATPGPSYTDAIPAQGVSFSSEPSGMNTNTMLAIGGGVLVLILGMVFVLKGKK